MFVVMTAGATEAEVLGVKSQILAEGMTPFDHARDGHTVIAVVTDKSGQELCRVAPRLVSAGWTQGY